MDNSDNLNIIVLHSMDRNGTIKSVRYERLIDSNKIISKTPIRAGSGGGGDDVTADAMCLNVTSKLCLRYPSFYDWTAAADNDTTTPSDAKRAKVTKIIISPPYYNAASSINNLNIPTMIQCQNCETIFPTKYQYQRHQCEFNAEKVVLKSELVLTAAAGGGDTTDGGTLNLGQRQMRDFECEICKKRFVSRTNLERHVPIHTITKETTCEHCNKQFVSVNRLRIHKENHCKRAGDITKFYRSDLTVWKCLKCHQVFSSTMQTNAHFENCTEVIDSTSSGSSDCDNKSNDEFIVPSTSNNNNCCSNSNKEGKNIRKIQKISTEILLQCEFCNRTYADKRMLLQHQKLHATDRNYECVICNVVFDGYVPATQHWMTKCTDNANLFFLPKLTYCKFCDRTFKSHEMLYNHKIKKRHYIPKLHKSLVSADAIVDNTSSLLQSNNIKNDQNHETANSNDEPIGKLVVVVENNKDVVDKIYEDVLMALEVPINKTSNNNNKATIITDNIADDIIAKEPYEIDHLQDALGAGENKENVDPEVKSIKSEPCSDEMDIIVSPPEIKKKRGRKRKMPKQPNHTVKNSKKNCTVTEDGYKYQCENCIKVWNSITDLESHREKEHKKNFSCNECGQVLQSNKALFIHQRAHKNLKPYVCDTCGRSYSQTSHLWQHMRFHQGIKPFACPHEGCEARYTIRPDLKDHIRKVHTRERPFKCNICGKCFLTGSVFYQHRLIHTNDRRYGCDVCGKRFFRADALNNHKRIHSNERPYPCSICGREFRQKGDRNKHLRTQHTFN